MRSALTIELRFDGIPNVNRTRMTEFGGRVAAQLADVRACATRVAERTPEAQGDIEVTAYAERAALRLTMGEDSAGNARLTRCVREALEDANLGGLERPTGARVTFSFRNTMAAAHAAQREAETREAEVTVTRTAGGFRAEGTFGLVSFDVEASSPEAARAFFSRMRDALPFLLDCRRRAGRRDHDPTADFSLRLMARGASLDARILSANIWDPMGQTCVTRATTRRANTAGAAPTGSAEAHIRYLPNP